MKLHLYFPCSRNASGVLQHFLLDNLIAAIDNHAFAAKCTGCNIVIIGHWMGVNASYAAAAANKTIGVAIVLPLLRSCT